MTYTIKNYLDKSDYQKLIDDIFDEGYGTEDCGEYYNENLYDFVWNKLEEFYNSCEDDFLGVHKYKDIPYITRQTMVKDFIINPAQLASEDIW